MANINDLNLKNEEVEVPDEEEIPESSLDFSVLPQPGRYQLRLPENLEDLWNTFIDKSGKEVLSAFFDREHPLVVEVDEDNGGEFTGETITFASVNNQARPRGREGRLVSDMQYLIIALEKDLPKEQKSKLSNAISFANALKKHAGESFRCRLSWNAYCNPKRNIRIFEDPDERGRTVEAEDQQGCGNSYYAPARSNNLEIPKDENGKFMSRFAELDLPGGTDDDGNPYCHAVLFARPQLTGFNPPKK